jgi:DNA-directed RNA polymerase subunit beta
MDIPTPKVPESFKVLIKELNALGLNVVPVGATISVTPVDVVPGETEVQKETEEKVEKEAKNLQEELGGEEVLEQTERAGEKSGVELAVSGEGRANE